MALELTLIGAQFDNESIIVYCVATRLERWALVDTS